MTFWASFATCGAALDSAEKWQGEWTLTHRPCGICRSSHDNPSSRPEGMRYHICPTDDTEEK